MVSINLATGHDIEMLADTFEALIANRRPPVRVRVSLLDPDLEYLAQAIAPVISTSPDTLRRRVLDTIGVLENLNQNRLARARREYLEVWCHKCLPNGSAIIIDGDSDRVSFSLRQKHIELAWIRVSDSRLRLVQIFSKHCVTHIDN